MKIDLESLTYDELVALNHKLVERLKFLDAMHSRFYLNHFFRYHRERSEMEHLPSPAAQGQKRQAEKSGCRQGHRPEKDEVSHRQPIPLLFLITDNQ